MDRVRHASRTAAACFLAGLLALLAAALWERDAGGAPGRRAAPAAANPCTGPGARHLRCPDMRMSRPSRLYVERSRRGHARLRATSSINVYGDGPLEVRGKRQGEYAMRARQRILRTGGRKPLLLPATGHLDFYPIPGQGHYWKYRNAARFELWTLDGRGRRDRLVRVGPKLDYCFRDLQRRHPRVHGSPRRRHYPGCNQSERKRRVTLGTSVGWSDVYPATYHEQWIDVTGLRGCFALAHMADPKDNLRELDETNNRAVRIVKLPWRGGAGNCRKRLR